MTQQRHFGAVLMGAALAALIAMSAVHRAVAQPPPGDEAKNEDVEKAYRVARAAVQRALQDGWPRERLVSYFATLRQEVDQHPLAQSAPEAMDFLGFAAWAHLGRPAESVRDYEKLLELHLLSRFAESAVHNLHWVCVRTLKEPEQARSVLVKYRKELASFEGQHLKPEEQAALLYLTALVDWYLGDETALRRLTQVKAEHPNTEWARRAGRTIALGDLQFAAYLRTFADTELRTDERDVGQDTRLERECSRQVQVRPVTPSPALLSYSLKLSADFPLHSASPRAAVADREGRSEVTWTAPRDLPIAHCGDAFLNYRASGVDRKEGADWRILRCSDDHGNGVHRIYLYVEAPEKVYLDVSMTDGARVVPDTASPKPYSLRDRAIFFWASGRGRSHGFDCTKGRMFSFDVEVPEGIVEYYPEVVVGTWRVRQPPGGTNKPFFSCGGMNPIPSAGANSVTWPGGEANTFRFDYAGTQVEFASSSPCRVALAEQNIRYSYKLGAIVRRVGDAEPERESGFPINARR